MLLAVFIYWGLDTAVSVNEETKDARKPRAGPRSSPPSCCSPSTCSSRPPPRRSRGIGTTGIGLGNPDNADDVFSVLGQRRVRQSAVGSFAVHLLILMVLSSAAASTLTTILPTARTTLSMAVHKAIPAKFARVSERYMTPTWSTVAWASPRSSSTSG